MDENIKKTSDDILEVVARARKLTKEYYLADYSDNKKRESILKELFGSIGKNVIVDSMFHCNFGKNVHIGDNVIININCTLIDDEKITIGNKVLIASNVQLYTAYHPILPEHRFVDDFEKKGELFFNTCAAPITIEDGVWIGGGAIILPNVTIGENSVIGAGSVVSRSIPKNCVAVGNPCRPIKYFDDIRGKNKCTNI